MFKDLIKDICPICKLEDDSIKKQSTSGTKFLIQCPRCKNFIVTMEALTMTTVSRSYSKAFSLDKRF